MQRWMKTLVVQSFHKQVLWDKFTAQIVPRDVGDAGSFAFGRKRIWK